MKRRYIYSILFGIPGFVLSLMLAFLVSGFALGILWLFVFGDSPWPSWTETLIPVVFALIFLTTWFTCVTIGLVIGKQREADPALNRKHIWASVGVTILFMLFIVFQQTGVGNLGPKSDGLRCSDFCTQKGYAASSMPPQDSGVRNCSCLDGSGHEIITVPLRDIDSVK